MLPSSRGPPSLLVPAGPEGWERRHDRATRIGPQWREGGEGRAGAIAAADTATTGRRRRRATARPEVPFYFLPLPGSYFSFQILFDHQIATKKRRKTPRSQAMMPLSKRGGADPKGDKSRAG